MPKPGLNKEIQKRTNRGLILRFIATRECTSRIELSRSTGLTKTAISQIVNGLIAEHYLVETEKEVGEGVGRNPMGLDISPLAPRFAGILIEREGCEAVVVDMQLNILSHREVRRVWKNAGELMDSVYGILDPMVRETENLAGIGAASIGPVSAREGKIIRPLYFNNIGNIELRRLLTERYHLPVMFDHDNQSAVLAEHLFGNGQGYQDILLVSVGRGIGCGILVGGKRVHSYTGYAPEIGHVSIDFRGPRCPCGNSGCLELYANSRTVLERLRAATGKKLSYAEFCGEGSPETEAVMEDVIFRLSSGITNTLNIMNSQLVLLARDCASWPDRYVQALEDRINRTKFGNLETRIIVRKVRFGEKAAVLGAACNMINRFFEGESPDRETAGRQPDEGTGGAE